MVLYVWDYKDSNVYIFIEFIRFCTIMKCLPIKYHFARMHVPPNENRWPVAHAFHCTQNICIRIILCLRGTTNNIVDRSTGQSSCVHTRNRRRYIPTRAFQGGPYTTKTVLL